MKKSKSASFLPNVLSNNLREIKVRHNNRLKNLFVTTLDDIGFANKQIEKIDDIVKKNKETEQKAWNRQILNNIYKFNGKSNYQALKEYSQHYKIVKKTDLSQIDWDKQLYLNKRQVNQILEGNKISKGVLQSVEITNRLRDKKVYLHEFVFQTKKISIKNLKIKLLKNERENVSKKENEYENALNYEKQSLENDIDKFDLYKIKTKQQLKNDETTLIKLNQMNKILFEEAKRLSNEYNYIVDEIIRYIALIINYKTYASFVYKLLGEEIDNFNLSLNDCINYKNWTEKDLNQYVKKALIGLETYLAKISLNERMLDVLSDNNRLEILFQIMEDNILKVFEEKEEFEENEKRIMEENMRQYNKLMNDYENNKFKYNMYLTDLKDEKKKIKAANIDPEQFEFYTYMSFLLEDICNFVLIIDNKKKIRKSVSQINLTSNNNNIDLGAYELYKERDVKNCFEALKEKQFYTQGLIDEIEMYKSEDPNLIRIIMSELRANNRFLRRQDEKQKEIQKEYEKREKFINKFKQNSIRQKYKFREPIPYHILKERRKHVVKYKPQSTSENLLFY